MTSEDFTDHPKWIEKVQGPMGFFSFSFDLFILFEFSFSFVSRFVYFVRGNVAVPND